MTGPNALKSILRVSFEATPGSPRNLEFFKSFRIGRTEENDICIKNEYVSRHHLEVSCANGQWSARDLNSSNGVFINGKRVEVISLAQTTTVRLGIEGPLVTLQVEQPPAPPPVKDFGSDTIMARYFGKETGEPMGDRTMMIRQAYSQVQKKQKWKYGQMMAVLGLIAIGAGAYALYLHKESSKRKALAETIFYTMKALDVSIARVETLVTESGSAKGQEEIRNSRKHRADMEKNYDQFLTSLHVYEAKMTPQDRLVLRVARIFGECELDIPPDFKVEVNKYIQQWKSSGRLARDVRRARDNGYTPVIARELLAQNLPPQFFYLALQESDFDATISGPITRKGYAKGMWQFIPETAVKYGLHIGPLVDLPRPDPGDDRHHWDRATKAAAAYLKDLYTTEAQASGFLVMACYNWGEKSVLPYVQKMPQNPRERNFWKLLTQHRDKVPDETYGYVLNIFAASVIGENPRLFGFDFDNPLEHLENQRN